MRAAVRSGGLRVVHLVDAMGTTRLWGKEGAIAALMEQQRRAGGPTRVVAFSPNALIDVMAATGFRADVLTGQRQRWPVRALAKLVALLREEPACVLHTHGYKANIVGRAARALGAPIARLVA